VAPKDEASEAPAKREGVLVAKNEGATDSKKSSDPDAKGKSKPAGATKKGPAAPKGAPAWTRGQPGVVKLVRGSETLEVRVLDRKQRLVPATLPQFARFLRSKSGVDHPIDARLVTLLAAVSDHFGGREVHVVSGFRPYSPGQYSRHSNHNQGRALDFSIKGIANETVRDFCRTLHSVGVGYYPNSLFVHLDVRDGANAYWVDYAAPGQAPRYRPADGKSDDDEEEDAIASVDNGPRTIASPSDTPRTDVTRGPNAKGGGDRDATGERGVFVNR
jgi:uncharacterized protein YcbK (DUF882 family)